MSVPIQSVASLPGGGRVLRLRPGGGAWSIRARACAVRALLVCAVPTLSGCMLEPRFDVGYTGEALAQAEPTRATLLALPFEDERPPRERQSMFRDLLCMIPLYPAASIRHSRMDEVILHLAKNHEIRPTSPSIPEGVLRRGGKQFLHFSRCFPAAIAADLQASGLFARADYRPEPAAYPTHHYVLRGTLRDSFLKQLKTAYGLSVAGVVPWLIGAPQGLVSCGIRLGLELTDAVSGEVVWEGELEEEVSSLFLAYGNYQVVYDGRNTASYVRKKNDLGSFDVEAKWRTPFQVPQGDDDDHLDSRSLYWWHFEALRKAMERAKPEIAAALAGRALPVLPPPTREERTKVTRVGPSKLRGPRSRPRSR